MYHKNTVIYDTILPHYFETTKVRINSGYEMKNTEAMKVDKISENFLGASGENHLNDEFRPQWKLGRKKVSDLY